MKRWLPNIAGVLLGLLFLMASIPFLLNKVPEQKIPEGTAEAMFMGAFGPTGYMTFVKVLELAGGLLVMIPKIRNIGLLVLGPIIINILAFHIFVARGKELHDPVALGMVSVIVLLALYLFWAGRKQFSALLTK